MSRYESLMFQYPHLTIKEDSKMPAKLAGLYFDYNIHINKWLSAYEKTGVLAEEIGHFETTYGDILDYQDMRKRKVEILARRWGYEKLVPLEKLVECYKMKLVRIDEVCIYLEVTDSYLKSALDFYKAKYGSHYLLDGFEITFDPLNIREI